MANEKRLIDADALKERFNLRIKWLEKDKHDDYTAGIWDGCLYDAKLIDEMPTLDAVEVVRCKDCKHKGIAWDDGMYMCHNPNYGMAGGVELRDDDFCSYGERKDKE